MIGRLDYARLVVKKNCGGRFTTPPHGEYKCIINIKNEGLFSLKIITVYFFCTKNYLLATGIV